jgi:hypothetical protein
MRLPKTLGFCVFSAGVLLVRPAAASDDDLGVDAAALAGYGVSSGVNVIGPGLGLRLGCLADPGVYLGALGLVHFGSSDEGESDVRHYSQSVRLELGYEIDLGPLDLRPALRGGLTHVRTPRDIDGRFWSPDLGLGVTVLVQLDGPFLGFDVDARFLTRLIENGDTLFSIAAVAGYWVVGYRF